MRFLSLIFLSLSFVAHAEIIQIIHTNDLHSYLEGTREGKGGYARLKTLIEKLKREAKAKNIPSLYLDGGDFGEGSSFFAADRGAMTFRALDLLAPDAAVLGNHDHILGPEELTDMMKRSGVKTPILSANIVAKKKLGLDAIAPSKDFKLGNLTVRVIGFSTPDKHAQYTLKPVAKIKNPIQTALPLLEKAKKDKVDFVISLSHLGISDDEEMVAKTTNLGLVVGGHDHLKFDEPRFATNKLGEKIAILQTGAHTVYVGAILLDVGTNGKAKILNYQLHEVSSDIEKETQVELMVEEAKRLREEFFGRSWNEVIGESEIPLTGRVEGRMKRTRSCWSKHLAKMSQEVMGADIGMQLDVFQSEEIAPGKITYGDMIDNFVHFNSWDPRGWELTTIRLTGLELKELLAFLKTTKNEFSSSFYGIEVADDKGKMQSFKPREHQGQAKFINGEPLRALKTYTIALPKEVPTAIERTVPILGKLLVRFAWQEKEVYFWPSMEEYIRKNSPLTCF